jgi:hypothetical protein
MVDGQQLNPQEGKPQIKHIDITTVEELSGRPPV